MRWLGIWVLESNIDHKRVTTLYEPWFEDCAKGTWPLARMQYILVINKEQGKLREGLKCSLGESIQEPGDLFGEVGEKPHQ